MLRQSIRLLWNIILSDDKHQMPNMKCKLKLCLMGTRVSAQARGRGHWRLLMSGCPGEIGECYLRHLDAWSVTSSGHQAAHLITSTGHKTPWSAHGGSHTQTRHKSLQTEFPPPSIHFLSYWYYYCPISVSLLNWILNGGWHEGAHNPELRVFLCLCSALYPMCSLVTSRRILSISISDHATREVWHPDVCLIKQIIL